MSDTNLMTRDEVDALEKLPISIDVKRLARTAQAAMEERDHYKRREREFLPSGLEGYEPGRICPRCEARMDRRGGLTLLEYEAAKAKGETK